MRKNRDLPEKLEHKGTFCVGAGMISANGVFLQNVPHTRPKRAETKPLPSPESIWVC